MEKILSISLKLNFTPNTLGCYGLNARVKVTGKGAKIMRWSYLARLAIFSPLPAAVPAAVAVEGRVARQQDVHDDPQGPKVATLVVRVRLADEGVHDFGGHELGGADGRQQLRRRDRRRQRIEFDARAEVEVADLDGTQFVRMDAQDVFRL